MIETLLLLSFAAGLAGGLWLAVLFRPKVAECPCRREKREAERADSWWRDGTGEGPPEYEP